MFFLLEGDGVIENIYHLLWTKDSIFGTGKLKIKLRASRYDTSHNIIQIPETLLLVFHFKKGQ